MRPIEIEDYLIQNVVDKTAKSRWAIMKETAHFTDSDEVLSAAIRLGWFPTTPLFLLEQFSEEE